MEHSLEYMVGRYNILDPIILDPIQAKNGVRSELWQGWLWQAKKPERIAEWEMRKAELQDAARRQLAEFRIFVTEREREQADWRGPGQERGEARAATIAGGDHEPPLCGTCAVLRHARQKHAPRTQAERRADYGLECLRKQTPLLDGTTAKIVW
jgi:hypothetical protein